jgi:hypothetical protein
MYYRFSDIAINSVNPSFMHTVVNKWKMIPGAPDKLRICIFYAMKTSKNACIIRSECTFTHTITYCCVSKLSKFGAYLYAVEDHPRNIPAKFGSNRPSGFGEEAWNVKSLQTTDDGRQVFGPGELKKYIIFRSALIHVLAHFQRTTCSQIHFRF